jgi:hypothetical protein
MKIKILTTFILLLFRVNIAHAEDGELSLEIVNNEHVSFYDNRSFNENIVIDKAQGNFHVILRNISNRSLKIFSDDLTEGLGFEFLDEQNHKTIVKIKPIDYTAHVLSYMLVKQNASYVFDVSFASTLWDGMPQIEKNKSKKFTIKAYFENRYPSNHGTWQGKISSKSKTIDVYNNL